MSKTIQIDKSKKFSEFFDKKNEPRKIDFIVLHHVQATSADHAVQQFKNYKVSSHFLIDEAGKIFELVNQNDVAYHAGVSFWRGVEGLNASSIGIEFVNSSPFEKKFTKLQMLAGVELCKELIRKYNIPINNIVGHSDIAYYPVQYSLPAPKEDESRVFSKLEVKKQDQIKKEREQKKTNEHSNLLDRKQDPSHLFDWKFFSQHSVGVYHAVSLSNLNDKVLFKIGDKNPAINPLKTKLAKFGYRLVNSNNEFDHEMLHLARVFNRHFNPKKFVQNSDVWYLSSQMMLDEMTLYLERHKK